MFRLTRKNTMVIKNNVLHDKQRHKSRKNVDNK